MEKNVANHQPVQYISIYFIATKSNSSTKQKVDKATAGT